MENSKSRTYMFHLLGKVDRYGRDRRKEIKYNDLASQLNNGQIKKLQSLEKEACDCTNDIIYYLHRFEDGEEFDFEAEFIIDASYEHLSEIEEELWDYLRSNSN